MNKFGTIIGNLLKEMGYGAPQSLFSNEDISIYAFKDEDMGKTQYYATINIFEVLILKNCRSLFIKV